jgi:hypothetical protein
VAAGRVEPLYFGRDQQDQFHETIRLEEESYRVKSPEPTNGNVPKELSKPPKEEKKKREAYGGIP